MTMMMIIMILELKNANFRGLCLIFCLHHTASQVEKRDIGCMMMMINVDDYNYDDERKTKA